LLKTFLGRRIDMTWKTSSVVLSVCVLICFAAAIAHAQTSPAFTPVPAAQIDEARKDKASRIATATLANWSRGQFAPLTDDFTAQMQASLTPEAQQMAIGNIRAMLGDLQSLAFAKAVSTPSMPGFVVYRFKGAFAKEPGEVRVVLDQQGKVAGLWVKPWQDMMQ